MVFYLAYALLALLAAVLIKVYLDVRKQRIALRHFPEPPIQDWLMGHCHKDFVTHQFMHTRRKWATEYSPIFRERVGPFNYVLVCSHPDVAKVILSRSDRRTPFVTEAVRDWGGESLFTTHGKVWQRKRKLLTPMFHLDVLKDYVVVYNECAAILVDKWTKLLNEVPQRGATGIFRDVYDDVKRISLDILMRCVFGLCTDCQVSEHNHPYIETTEKLTRFATMCMLEGLYHIPGVFWLLHGREKKRLLEINNRFSREVVRKRRAELEQEAKRKTLELGDSASSDEYFSGFRPSRKKYSDFIDLLIKAKHEDGRELTDEEVRWEAATFIFGGHDTVSAAMTYTLYHLAIHPEFQKKCREEAQSVLGDKNEIFFDDLNNLSFLTMCFSESMRIMPPAQGAGKMMEEDVQLPDGRVIPKGTNVYVGINHMHFNANVWENPEVYDPYRFEPEKVAARSPHAYLPFSAGPHNCIGRYFATNVAKTVLAHILARFSFQVDATREYRHMHDFITHPVGGLHLIIKPA